MSRSVWSLVLAFALAVSIQARPAAAYETIDEMAAIDETVREFGDQYGPSRVLIVFDIDNTLLTMPQDLGSDAWFGWQVDLLLNDTESPMLAAADFRGLLAAQGLVYSASKMRPTEPDIAERVDGYEGRGFPVMALTARGPSIRDATLRVLAADSILFDHAPRCAPPLCLKRGIVDRGAIIAASRQVFSDAEFSAFKLASPRPVSVSDGVMMVAGQNKGAMLRLLLAGASEPRPLAVVFVDDALSNVENMEGAFKDQGTALAAFHYTRMEHDAKAFRESPERQAAAAEAWDRLSVALCADLAVWCRN